MAKRAKTDTKAERKRPVSLIQIPVDDVELLPRFRAAAGSLYLPMSRFGLIAILEMVERIETGAVDNAALRKKHGLTWP